MILGTPLTCSVTKTSMRIRSPFRILSMIVSAIRCSSLLLVPEVSVASGRSPGPTNRSLTTVIAKLHEAVEACQDATLGIRNHERSVAVPVYGIEALGPVARLTRREQRGASSGQAE